MSSTYGLAPYSSNSRRTYKWWATAQTVFTSMSLSSAARVISAMTSTGTAAFRIAVTNVRPMGFAWMVAFVNVLTNSFTIIAMSAYRLVRLAVRMVSVTWMARVFARGATSWIRHESTACRAVSLVVRAMRSASSRISAIVLRDIRVRCHPAPWAVSPFVYRIVVSGTV